MENAFAASVAILLSTSFFFPNPDLRAAPPMELTTGVNFQIKLETADEDSPEVVEPLNMFSAWTQAWGKHVGRVAPPYFFQNSQGGLYESPQIGVE